MRQQPSVESITGSVVSVLWAIASTKQHDERVSWMGNGYYYLVTINMVNKVSLTSLVLCSIRFIEVCGH